MTRTIRKVLAVAGACFLFANAHAWDGVTSGVPGALEVTNGGNYGLRIYLANQTSMCGSSTPTWIYLEPTDSNYSTYLAVLLFAKAQGTPVTLYGIREANGFCRLGHMLAS